MNKNHRLLYMLAAVLLVAGLIMALLYAFRSRQESADNMSAGQLPLPGEAVDRTADENIAPELDARFITYTSPKGFTVSIPKQTMAAYATCEFKANENSYRPGIAPVAIKAFEDTNATYIAQEYYYKLGGETRRGDISYYSSCDKTSMSLPILKDIVPNNIPLAWAIEVVDVRSDQQLLNLVRTRFGAGCKVGQRTAASQAGVFDVAVLTDGKDLGETDCALNYNYVLKHYPAKQKVAFWKLGQSCYYSGDNGTCLDEEMAKSFRFQ